jgi:hypothetical protein
MTLYRLLEAFGQYTEKGDNSIACDNCGAVIKFHMLGEDSYHSTCSCGKYNETLRGI